MAGVFGKEFGVNDLAIVAQSQAPGEAVFGNASPDDVALAHMPETLGAVEQVVDLAFENGLKIGLHFAAGDFDPDGQGQGGSFWHAVDIGGR